MLDWRDADPDGRFGPHQLSDGTLRAIALIALLQQPEQRLPKVIIIDEPELGLHPYAIELVAALIKAAANHAQVIIATQSPRLVDQFEPADIVVVDRQDGATTLSRPDPDRLRDWLDEYSLGDLWERTSSGGGPDLDSAGVPRRRAVGRELRQ